MTREHEHEIEIDATSDQVWQAITDPGELTRWYVEGATVTPGEGGSITVSWGDSADLQGTGLIEEWEPGRRLRLVHQIPEDSPFPKMDEPTVEEWVIESRGGRTVLRLVNSGIPDTAEWDDYYDSTDFGWDMFFYRLRHYLERHPGEPRHSVIAQGESTEQAWPRLLGLLGVDGDRYEAKLPTGETLSGSVVLCRPGKVLLTTVDELDDGLLAITVEGTYLWANLSAYGAAKDGFDALKGPWSAWILTAGQQPAR